MPLSVSPGVQMLFVSSLFSTFHTTQASRSDIFRKGSIDYINRKLNSSTPKWWKKSPPRRNLNTECKDKRNTGQHFTRRANGYALSLFSIFFFYSSHKMQKVLEGISCIDGSQYTTGTLFTDSEMTKEKVNLGGI